MFSYISELFSDPKGMLIVLLLALPGRLLAISGHEAAHAYAAYRCGDPTAKFCGRMTINPFRHLDLVGTLMMLFLGFGWAKPVPVNPNNFKRPRRDDLIVSIAGICANIAMAIAGAVLMYGLVGWALARMKNDPELYLRFLYSNDNAVVVALGAVPGYILQMLSYFVTVNIALAFFNLLPVPPLDGYHVLNDLILKKPLFASRKATEIATFVMIFLIVTGAVGKVLGVVVGFLYDAMGSAAFAVFRAIGIL